ncbi:unnamed protein product [Moneuplotes crassus]|uniref:Uncharacterized protein n=1 Tax=Euplotes crassus TaxID=5936 RepID=A0AAD1X683_EUPCR|nr:unnamed protein product [Moneuplotes crassus]
MGSCNCTQKSEEVELEIPPRPKSLLKNKFSQNKDVQNKKLPRLRCPSHEKRNDPQNYQRKKTLQELYDIVRRCKIILEEYQSCRSDSHPLSLHQISRVISEIGSSFKINCFWIQNDKEFEKLKTFEEEFKEYDEESDKEYNEHMSVVGAFRHLHSQIYGLKQELIFINKVTENQQTKKIIPKEDHKEMDGKQGGQLVCLINSPNSKQKNPIAAKAPQDILCTALERSQEAVSLNLVLTFETLYRLSCDGLNQKIYQDSYENICDSNFGLFSNFFHKPGENFRVNHRNYKGSITAKKLRKVALPWFIDVTVKTNPKSLKLFHESVAHFSPCGGMKTLTLEVLEPTEIGLYLQQIIKTCAHVQKEICLCGFNLNEIQFKKFLMGCRHQEQVSFRSCKFAIPRVSDLKTCMKGTLIKKIGFCSCDENYELSKYSETIDNLINGISSCDLKESLTEIYILDYLARGYFNSTFEKYGLGDKGVNHSLS